MTTANKLPSIRRRLARAMLVWALIWAAAVAVAVWLTVRQEVDELLDDALQSSAELLTTMLSMEGAQPAPAAAGGNAGQGRREELSGAQFAWQVVGPGGQLLLRSPQAPTQPFYAAPHAGFTDLENWRVFGVALGGQASAPQAAAAPHGRMLYVAQGGEERDDVQAEIALNAALVALAVGLLGHLWLRGRVQAELAPLQTLSDRLRDHDPLDAGASLGPAEREELQPMHAAIDALARRLNQRVLQERAFAAHAAHSLRTPLAGIDAQLAVALRESPPDMQPRLQRVRDGAARLQRVVAALLTLFRTGVDPQRQSIDLPSLLARLPVDGLTVEVAATRGTLQADPDLLSAALLNLLDNSLRQGATHVMVSLSGPDTVRFKDNGPGLPEDKRAALQSALSQQAYEGRMGLGLMLADLVARSHGGRLLLPGGQGEGFTVDVALG